MISKTRMVYGLIAAIVFQLLVLLIEYAGAVYPLYTGTEIKVKVIPVDPRSLFRGNYARLNYDISRVSFEFESREPRMNEIVYVSLKQDEDGYYIKERVSYDKPEQGLFIKGRVSGWGGDKVRYGIEAYFAPKDRALQLEKDLRSGGVAVLMLASNGKATLKDIVAN